MIAYWCCANAVLIIAMLLNYGANIIGVRQDLIESRPRMDSVLGVSFAEDSPDRDGPYGEAFRYMATSAPFTTR